MSILGTIGLCRWRARKLRKLRDIEKLEKQKSGDEEDRSGEDDENSDAASTGSATSDGLSEKKRRKSTVNGSSSAIRKIHKRLARFRRRHRVKKSETIEEIVAQRFVERGPRPEDSSAASIISNTTSVSRSSTSRRSISHRSAASASAEGTIENHVAPLRNTLDDAMEPPPPPPPIHPDLSMGNIVGEGGSERGRPRITITGSENIPPPLSPNAEPPAYPTTSGNLQVRTGNAVEDHRSSPIPEKAPIPGLEAEYDDRDLASYVGTTTTTSSGLFNSRLSTSGTRLSVRTSAPPTRRPSRVRFVDEAEEHQQRVDGGGNGQEEQDETEEQVPSFEAFDSLPGSSSLAGAVRVAAGATRRAHIATDDKGILERMRELSDEPSMGHVPSEPQPPPPPPPSVLLSDVDQPRDGDIIVRPPPPPGTLAAVAPSFTEIDQWELERQMALTNGAPVSTSNLESPSTTASTSVTTSPSSYHRAANPSNGFPALPLPVSSMSGSADVGYGLGTVWSGLNVAAPSGSSTSRSGKARVPSAPPLDVPSSRPSAPPPMLDEPSGIELASAPPAWDDEEEVDGGSIALEGSTSQGRAIDTLPEASEATTSNTRQPESPMVLPIPHADVDIDADTDADGNGSDADGAESVISTPPDIEDVNSRWSATFRTRASEGAGLPRYEP
jgi:hypothetical protein